MAQTTDEDTDTDNTSIETPISSAINAAPAPYDSRADILDRLQKAGAGPQASLGFYAGVTGSNDANLSKEQVDALFSHKRYKSVINGLSLDDSLDNGLNVAINTAKAAPDSEYDNRLSFAKQLAAVRDANNGQLPTAVPASAGPTDVVPLDQQTLARGIAPVSTVANPNAVMPNTSGAAGPGPGAPQQGGGLLDGLGGIFSGLTGGFGNPFGSAANAATGQGGGGGLLGGNGLLGSLAPGLAPGGQPNRALMGLGLALQSINNPSVAGAMTQLAMYQPNNKREYLDGGVSADKSYRTYYDPATGKTIKIPLGPAVAPKPQAIHYSNGDYSPDGKWFRGIDPVTGNVVVKPVPQPGAPSGNPSLPTIYPAAPSATPETSTDEEGTNDTVAPAPNLPTIRPTGGPGATPAAPPAPVAAPPQPENGGKAPKVDVSMTTPEVFPTVPESEAEMSQGAANGNPFAKVKPQSPQAAARFNKQINDATQGLNRAEFGLKAMQKAQSIIESGNLSPSYFSRIKQGAENMMNIPDAAGDDVKDVDTAFATAKSIAANALQKGQGTNESRKMIADEFLPNHAEYSSTKLSGASVRVMSFLSQEYATQAQTAANAYRDNPQYNIQMPGQPKGVRYSDYLDSKAQYWREQAKQSGASSERFLKQQNNPDQTPAPANPNARQVTNGGAAAAPKAPLGSLANPYSYDQIKKAGPNDHVTYNGQIYQLPSSDALNVGP